jgi:hypothetical protein
LWWLLCRNFVPWGIRKRALGKFVVSEAAFKLGSDPFYEWKWLGVPLREIPPVVNIGGSRRQVTCAEGLIVFSQAGGVYGHHSRISFRRDCDGMLWYVEFSETFGRVPVCDIVGCFDVVRAVYGGDFERKGGAT